MRLFSRDRKRLGIVYVLLFESGEYYIGSTRQLKSRLHNHSRKQRFPYILLESYAYLCNDRDLRGFEDAVTEDYIDSFGLESVRGGKYVNPTILPPQYYEEVQPNEYEFNFNLKYKESII